MSEIWTGHSRACLSLVSRFLNHQLDDLDTEDWNHLQMTHLFMNDADSSLTPELGLFAGRPTHNFSMGPGFLIIWYLVLRMNVPKERARQKQYVCLFLNKLSSLKLAF